jgi:uncharacterized protein (TIGR02246 family)
MSGSGAPSSATALTVYRRLLEAWNERDAKAFAALFTNDGSAIGFDGSQMNGAAEIAEALARVFADHQTAAYVAKVREVRQIDQRTAILRAVVGMIPRGSIDLNPAVNAVQSLVVVGSGAEARIALLQNTPAAFHGRPEAGAALTGELARVAASGAVLEA